MNTNMCMGKVYRWGGNMRACAQAQTDTQGKRNDCCAGWIHIQIAGREFHLLWLTRMMLMWADNNLPGLIENVVFFPNTWREKK